MNRKTIRNHKDFLMPKDAAFVKTDCFIIKAQPVKPGFCSRYGILVSKRRFKLAVHRNRAKRLMRDWIAFNENAMSPDLDYVFIPNSLVFEYSREDARKKMYNAIRKISKIYEKNEK